jgi:polar amino acid transport system permease protein
VRWSRFFIAATNPGAPPPSPPVRAFNWLLVGLALSLVFFFCFHQIAYQWDWKPVGLHWEMFLNGWLCTILISAAALVLSTLVGLLLALARRSRVLVLRYFGKIYIEVVRGTPLLVQIMILYYVVATAFHMENRAVAGVLILSGFSGAYIAEIIRAGIESVAASQLESAQAIGLTRRQIYRHVIFPQALRQTLPSLAGQFASLIKDSSLLYVIGTPEFTNKVLSVNATTFRIYECYLPLALGYLVLTLPISLWTRRLEERHKFET